jgi:hypothetical protein
MRHALLVITAALVTTWSACTRTEPAISVPSQLRPDTWADRTFAKEDEPWYQNHLRTAYDSFGQKDPRWDEPMRRLLDTVAHHRARAGTATPPDLIQLIEETAGAGCTDPLFLYLQARYQPDGEHNFIQAESAMRTSRYGPLERFYAAWRSGMQLDSADQAAAAQRLGEAVDLLKQVLREPTMLPREAERIVFNFSYFVRRTSGRTACYRVESDVLPILAARWPNDPDILRCSGAVHIQLGWLARGTGWSYTVTPEGSERWQKELAIAEELLEASWKLAPSPDTADFMMEVELGQGRGRDRMELWFSRAMQLDPGNTKVCASKMFYLTPRWYGSRDELIKFARECATNRAWGGAVPLCVFNTLEYVEDDLPADERLGFWTRKEIWAITSAAYERYLELYPGDINQRQQFILAAYRARAWKILNRQLKAAEGLDPAFFGGEAALASLIEQAKSHQSWF